MLVLTRQGVPTLDRSELAAADGLRRGAYVLAPERGETPDVLLIASGSEVAPALEARAELAADGVDARVVSFPSWELFRRQPQAYREEVLPPGVAARVAVEAGATLGWSEWVGPAGAVVGIDRFGASASHEDNFRAYGLTATDVAKVARSLLGGGGG